MSNDKILEEVYMPRRTQALLYEVQSSWWAQWVSWGPLQDLAAWHYARKVNKKMDRIEKGIARIKAINALVKES